MVMLKYLLILLVIITALTNLQLSRVALQSPHVYRKDFIQEYLLVKAVANDVDPYLELPELAERFLGPLPHPVLQHPTPHPPAVVLLSLPLALLDYQNAAAVWLVFEIVCIICGVYFLLRWFKRRPGFALTLFGAFAMLGWSPTGAELILGQLMTVLLLLLIGTWFALRDGADVLGGVLLGLTIVLKLIAWPIVIFLVFRRRWRAVIAVFISVGAANLISAMLMGFDRVLYFYLRGGSAVAALYHGYEYNFSLWTIGWKLFEGTGSPVAVGISAPPLVQSSVLARVVSVALPLGFLVVGLVLAVRAQSFDASYGILICTIILVSPVAWRHYLVLSLIPLAIIVKRVIALDWPTRETNVSLFLGLLLFIPRDFFDKTLLVLSGHATTSEIPLAIGVARYVPVVALVGLTALLWHLDCSEESGQQASYSSSVRKNPWRTLAG